MACCSRPTRPKEVAAQNLINLLADQGKLDGKTVAVLADQDSEGARQRRDRARPRRSRWRRPGSTAVLSITGTDTTAAQAQLDSFIEKWKTEDVDTIFIAGLNVSAKQFVEKLKDGDAGRAR